MRFSRRLLLAFLLLTPVAVPAPEAWPAAARLDAYFDALQKNQLANGARRLGYWNGSAARNQLP
jgi:hypothetical protein